MTRLLQFVGPLGEPVYFRPDRVDGVREVALTVNGRPVRGAFVLLASRETFKVQGSADAVAAAIEQWQAEHEPKFAELATVGDGPEAVLNGIRDALETRGFFHMANGRDIGALLDEAGAKS